MLIQEVLNRLAENTGTAVTLESPSGQIIAYSPHPESLISLDKARLGTILSRKVPTPVFEYLYRIGVYRSVAASNEPVKVGPFDDIGLGERVAMPIRKGKRLLAFLWLIGLEASSVSDASGRLKWAAKQISVALEAEMDQSSSLLHDLSNILGCVSVDAQGVVSSRAGQNMGLSLKPPFCILAIRTQCPDRANEPALDSEFIRKCHEAVSETGVEHLLDCIADTLVILCGGEKLHSIGRHGAEKLGHHVRSSADRPGVSLVIGIGRQMPEVNGIAASYRDALEALELSSLLNGEGSSPPVVLYERVALLGLIRCLTQCEQASQFGRDTVSALHKYDSLHGTCLHQTLQTYLEARGNRSETSRKLHVHPNTLDYRLGRIVDISGIDLSDPDQWLAALIWAKAASFSMKQGSHCRILTNQ